MWFPDILMTPEEKVPEDPIVSPKAANFIRLLNEGDRQKIARYFSRYGIDPQLALLNLDIFIEEELRDLGIQIEDSDEDLGYGS